MNYNIEGICRRFLVTYTGAISDVLDEMGYHSHVLPPEIHGLIPDQSVEGVAMPVEGQPTESQGPEEICVPTIKMPGSLTHAM